MRVLGRARVLYITFLILDIHTAQEVVGYDVQAVGILVCDSCSMVAYAADETAALDHDVHRLRHKEFHAATEGMDFDLLILCDGRIPQVHADTATESIETCSVERLTMIDVLIAAVVHAATNALAVFTNRQRTLQPLVGVATIAVDDETYAYIDQHTDAEIGNPRLL